MMKTRYRFLGCCALWQSPRRKNCKVILAAINDDQLDEAVKSIEDVVGDLTKENTGVVFSLPLDFAKGICSIGK